MQRAIERLKSVPGSESGTPVNSFEVSKEYFKTRAFVAVKIEPEDRMTSDSGRHRSAWKMYFVLKPAYEQHMRKGLSNMFDAFVIIDMDKAPIHYRDGMTERRKAMVNKLTSICQTHYLVLRILRMKQKDHYNVSQTDRVDIKFLGMHIPILRSSSGIWDMNPYDLKIVEMFLYGSWIQPGESIGRRNAPRTAKDISNKANSGEGIAARGGTMASVYRKHRDEVNAMILKKLSLGLAEVGYAG